MEKSPWLRIKSANFSLHSPKNFEKSRGRKIRTFSMGFSTFSWTLGGFEPRRSHNRGFKGPQGVTGLMLMSRWFNMRASESRGLIYFSFYFPLFHFHLPRFCTLKAPKMHVEGIGCCVVGCIAASFCLSYLWFVHARESPPSVDFCTMIVVSVYVFFFLFFVNIL